MVWIAAKNSGKCSLYLDGRVSSCSQWVYTCELAGLGLRKSSSYTLSKTSVAPEVKDGLCMKTGEDMGKRDGAWLILWVMGRH